MLIFSADKQGGLEMWRDMRASPWGARALSHMCAHESPQRLQLNVCAWNFPWALQGCVHADWSAERQSGLEKWRDMRASTGTRA